MGIKVTREEIGKAVVFAVEGSVDIASSPELRGELRLELGLDGALAGEHLAVDLGLLGAAHHDARARGVELWPAGAARHLEHVHLRVLFEAARDVAAGVAEDDEMRREVDACVERAGTRSDK